jgi:hypothetical protein
MSQGNPTRRGTDVPAIQPDLWTTAGSQSASSPPAPSSPVTGNARTASRAPAGRGCAICGRPVDIITTPHRRRAVLNPDGTARKGEFVVMHIDCEGGS